MDHGEKIYSKVSSLWPIVQECSRDFLLINLPLLLKEKNITKYRYEKKKRKESRVPSQDFKNVDELAKSCLSGLMNEHFSTVQDCQDVYVLCTIITTLFNGMKADAATEVRNKRNVWAHSNSGALY